MELFLTSIAISTGSPAIVIILLLLLHHYYMRNPLNALCHVGRFVTRLLVKPLAQDFGDRTHGSPCETNMRATSAMLGALGLAMRASATVLVWETLVAGHSSTNSYAGATVNGDMVIFGGTNKLYRLDLEGTPQQWWHIQPSGTAPSGSWSHMAGSRTHDELIIFGGNRDVTGDDNVYRLTADDSNAFAWLQITVTGTRPTRRDYHGAIKLADGSLLIYGGFTKEVWQLNFQDVARSTGHWQSISITDATTYGPGAKARLNPAGVQGPDGRLLTFAGHNDFSTHYNDVFRLVLNGSVGTWQEIVVSGTKPAVRSLSTAVPVPDGMLIWGGFNDEPGHPQKQTSYADVWHLTLDAVDATNGVWHDLTPVGSAPFTGSFAQSSIICGVGMVITKGTQTAALNFTTGCAEGEAWADGHCNSCPSGFSSAGGCARECHPVSCPEGQVLSNSTCLPTLAHAVKELPMPNFSAWSDGGLVHLSFEAQLPLIAEDVPVAYWPDLVPTIMQSSLDTMPACSDHWNQTASAQTIELSLTLNYSELDGDCQLNTSWTDDTVARQGFAVLSFVAGVDPLPQAFWYFPVTITFDRTTHASFAGMVSGRFVIAGSTLVNVQFDGSLALYDSASFAVPQVPAVYTAQEMAFVEMTLSAPGMELHVDLAWLSQTSDPEAPMRHNLTDSLQLISATASQARFSVQLQAGVWVRAGWGLLPEVTAIWPNSVQPWSPSLRPATNAFCTS